MVLHSRIPKQADGDRFLVRITDDADLLDPLRANEALVTRGNHDNKAAGFRAAIRIGGNRRDGEIHLSEDFEYLGNGDIVRIDSRTGQFQVMYRRNSPHNILFVTERCNSRCLMCSQPPRDVDDGYLVDEIIEAIPLMSKETRELCITGGEPTLLQHRLIEIIEASKFWLPDTGLHMLSNGRMFSYLKLSEAIAGIEHRDLMIGIPLYADVADRHDFVVQAKGAFDQTIRGILNLARLKQKIEIRVVIHKQTASRLPQIARFIRKNLPFVQHVTFMGLEMTGYTKSNLEALWIDPVDYQSNLSDAIEELLPSKIRTSIYNHQLCLLPRRLWPFAVKSISDWKNIYMSECAACTAKEKCGGFFASAITRYSKNIKPVEAF